MQKSSRASTVTQERHGEADLRGEPVLTARKVVYSTTLTAPVTANTRLERHLDPSAVRALKAAAGGDLLVGGPDLAGQALVDELALFVWPVVLGGRNPALQANSRADLELIDEHRFSSGVLHLRYRVR